MVYCNVTDSHQFSQRLAAQFQFTHFLLDAVPDDRPAGRCLDWKRKVFPFLIEKLQYPFKMAVTGKPITTFPLVDCIDRSIKVSSHLSHTETQLQSLLPHSLAYGFLAGDSFEVLARYYRILQPPNEDELFVPIGSRVSFCANASFRAKPAGIITDYRERYRWSRRTDPNTPEPIARALGTGPYPAQESGRCGSGRQPGGVLPRV